MSEPAEPEDEVRDPLVWAALATVLCCPPYAVAAITASHRARTLMGEGDRPGAEEAAGRAWSHFRRSVVLGLISNVLVFGFIAWALYYIATHWDELARPAAGPVGMSWRQAIWAVLAVAGPWSCRRGPAIVGGVALLGTGAVAVIRASVQDPSIDAWAPACLFRVATGWQCPGCGSLRAVHLLAHGNPAEAFAMNPALFGLAPIAGLAILASRTGDAATRRRARRAAWFVVVAMLAFGVLRNVG